MISSKKLLQTVISLFLILLMIGNIVSAQSVTARLDSWLEENAKEMGGRVFLVICKDGKMIYANGVNEMNARQKLVGRFLARKQGKEANVEDYTLSTRQPMASCSKWLSAALVMSFVDEGKLSLNDTIGRFLPVFTRYGKENITISQCLSHLTAIKAPELKESLQEMKNISSMEEAMNNLAPLPMEGEPGKVFHYSNAGLQIAGAVIEKISGKSFETLFAERIAGPLGMIHTDFGKGKVALPAGGANSTPEDYSKFLTMILNKGVYQGKRILSEKSVAEMQVNRITKDVTVAYAPAEAGNFGYGFGEWVMETSSSDNLSKSVTSPGLFGSFPWVDNDKKYCGFLMAVNLNNKGRNEKYKSLKALADELVK